jgi:hypothetical protein
MAPNHLKMEVEKRSETSVQRLSHYIQPTYKKSLSINQNYEEDYLLLRDIVQFGKNVIDVSQECTSSRCVPPKPR